MPKWWVDAHPDEVVSTPRSGEREALFSKVFRDDAKSLLIQMIEHIKSSNYWNRIGGWMICGGQTHRCDIGKPEIGAGVITRLPDLLANHYHILLVADQNTYDVCGALISDLLESRTETKCSFQTNELLVPNEESIAEIKRHLTEKTDFILGIGSGVINDLCKYVSFYRGLKCGIIATAPSMDGFASSGAAMILGGIKVTDTTHAPDLILGDIDILKNAPMDMIRSGYADIIGKYSALCDWKLSALINNEYLCQPVYDLVKEKTDQIRKMAGALTQRDSDAIGTLMEALVLIGACLTLLSTTRPGSGSEHHLSHYFEITGLIDDKPYFLHGTDVGYATIVTARLREEIRKIETPVFHHLPTALREACYRKIYGRYWKMVRDLQKDAARYDHPVDDQYLARWDEVCSILSECPNSEEIASMLTDVGFDLSLFEKMYGKKKIQNGVWFAKDLKYRYSVLWLYDNLFLNESEAAKIVETHNI